MCAWSEHTLPTELSSESHKIYLKELMDNDTTKMGVTELLARAAPLCNTTIKDKQTQIICECVQRKNKYSRDFSLNAKG